MAGGRVARARKKPVREIATDLGISDATLYSGIRERR
jgi:hypothetical protein